MESGFEMLLPRIRALGELLRFKDDEGCFNVDVDDDLGLSLLISLGTEIGVSRLSSMGSGALVGVEYVFVFAFRLLWDLAAAGLSSVVAGVGAREEFCLDSGSAMVDAEPCRPVKSTTRFCGAGVTTGDSGLDWPDFCRCRWLWTGC